MRQVRLKESKQLYQRNNWSYTKMILIFFIGNISKFLSYFMQLKPKTTPSKVIDIFTQESQNQNSLRPYLFTHLETPYFLVTRTPEFLQAPRCRGFRVWDPI